MKNQTPNITLAFFMLLTSMACTSYGMQRQRLLWPVFLHEYSGTVSPWDLDIALRPAVTLRNYSKVRQLLEAGAHIDVRTIGEETLLHHAIIDLKMTDLLLQHGAQVDPHDLIGYTPLHYAAQQGGSAVVKLLLQHKAFVDARDHAGKTPLFDALYLSLEDRSAVIELLLHHGAAINAHDNDGETTVHRVARRYMCGNCDDKLDMLHEAQFADQLTPDSQ